MNQDAENVVDRFCHPGVEKSVLSCIVKNPNLLVSSPREVSPEHFLSPSARELFICLDSLYTKNVENFSADALWNEAKNLKNLTVLNTQDGYEFIKVVIDSLIPHKLYEYYLNELVERADKYKLFCLADKFKEKIIRNVENVKSSMSFEDLVGGIESDIYGLTANANQNKESVDFATYVVEFMEKLKSPPIDILGVRSGFIALDRLLNGFKDGSLYIVAARAKQGKSSLLLEWAKHIAFFENTPVLYIDTEMNKELMMRRLVAQLTQLTIKELENRTYSHDPVTLEAIDLAQDIVQNGNFKYKNLPRFSPELLRFEIKKFIKQQGKGVVVFDYIKLPDGLDLKLANETQQLGYLTTSLKSLGNELEIPIISAVQFNREAVGRDPKSNYISGSDRILHYADTLMAIRKLSPKEIAYYRTRYGSYGAVINGMISIMDSRSTSAGSGVLLEMDLERASIKEACEQAIENADSQEYSSEE